MLRVVQLVTLLMVMLIAGHPPAEAQTASPAVGTLRLLAIGKDAEPIADLRADQLELRIDKQLAKILSLVPSASAPRYIGLLFDISGSRRSDSLIPEEVQAASQFLSAIWRPDDVAFIAAFGERTVLLAQPTNDLRQVEKGLQLVPKAQYRGATALYDALWAVHVSGPSVPDGEVLLIVFGDCDDNTSSHPLDSTAQEMAKRGIRVFPLLRSPDDLIGKGNRRGKTIAKSLARSTGGEVLVVENQKDLALAFRRLESELKGAYRLTYELPPLRKRQPKLQLLTKYPSASFLFAQ